MCWIKIERGFSFGFGFVHRLHPCEEIVFNYAMYLCKKEGCIVIKMGWQQEGDESF